MILGIGSLAIPLLAIIVTRILGIDLLAAGRLGMIALLVPFLLGVPAVVLGLHGLRSIDRNPQDLTGKGTAAGGLLLGGIQIAVSLLAFITWSEGSRYTVARIVSVNNLRQIGIACHEHHDAYGYFPSDNSRLSWRVRILPYLEQKWLFDQFHHDEPWDSPHNIKLLPLMPKVYLDPRFDLLPWLCRDR